MMKIFTKSLSLLLSVTFLISQAITVLPLNKPNNNNSNHETTFIMNLKDDITPYNDDRFDV